MNNVILFFAFYIEEVEINDFTILPCSVRFIL